LRGKGHFQAESSSRIRRVAANRIGQSAAARHVYRSSASAAQAFANNQMTARYRITGGSKEIEP
jgi:hypothetical protein